MIDLPEYLLFTSILFLFLSCAIVLTFVVPLQIEQSQVKNGLSILRKMLLLKGVTFLVTGSIAFYYLLRAALRVINEGINISLTNGIILFVFCLGYLILAAAAYKIYHIKYIDEYKGKPLSRKTKRRI